MGGGSWTDDAYNALSSSYSGKTRSQIFTSSTVSSDMSPRGLVMRESRDSAEHPNSVAVTVGIDVTGSMGRIAEDIARVKMGTLMPTMLKHNVPDPQIMFLGLGDHLSDRCPFQVGQFESETTLLDKWLTSIYLEGNGGGQMMESYLLAWLLCGRHVSADCFEKRGQKAFLFTVGDEWTHPVLEPEKVEQIMGYRPSEPMPAEMLLREAQRTHHVFHLHVNDASYRDSPRVIDPWRALLGERLLVVEHDIISETIATTVAVVNGADVSAVTSGFGKNALAVAKAVSGITVATNGHSTGIVAL